ncbi:MAG: HAMP domain-containing histidine kinase [Gammaproteobacteria bacterium]|nr:HAMP domain-containing histidine kinase [Gammaproteobacteria bacterium]
MSKQHTVTIAANLKRLLGVRALLLAGVLLLMLVVHYGFALSLPLAPLLLIIAALALLTLGSWWRAQRHAGALRDGELPGQLALDVVGLTALLYFSGGWTNPLVSLYLVPIAVAVIMLDGVRTWAIMAMTVLGYSLLVLYHRPVVAVEHHPLDSFTLHVAGMWLTFVLAAVLITYFGTSMVNLLRVREQALAAEREENLRNEQIIGVATLAAGTAHELSTPLSSIAVIASELADQADEANRKQLDTLLAQVAICRETLGRLRMTASGEPSSPPLPVDELLGELGARLALLRPRARLQLTSDGQGPAPAIRPEPTLQQALLNLLDNAAAVSDQPVDCRLHWNAQAIDIDILDQGPGFQTDAAVPIGKDEGLGMGLLLANATIERFGGRVSLRQRPGGGAHVAVRLPLDSLRPAS